MADGELGPELVNVAEQEHDPESLLNWMTRVVRLRRESPEIGLGEPAPVEVDDSAVLAHRCDWRGRTVVCVHNLGGRAAGVRLGGFDELVDLFTGKRTSPEVELEPYGYRWFRAAG
jgi:maltose alpha-D-glucosyltransferase/alpha-amylase